MSKDQALFLMQQKQLLHKLGSFFLIPLVLNLELYLEELG